MYVVDQKVLGKPPPQGQTLTAKNCSLILTKYGEATSAQQWTHQAEGWNEENVSVEMNVEMAKPLRKLKVSVVVGFQKLARVFEILQTVSLPYPNTSHTTHHNHSLLLLVKQCYI